MTTEPRPEERLQDLMAELFRKAVALHEQAITSNKASDFNRLQDLLSGIVDAVGAESPEIAARIRARFPQLRVRVPEGYDSGPARKRKRSRH